MKKAAVIGAGLGGLAAAIGLASRGASVTVFEASSAPGGKAGTVTLDGVEVDTGPSVLTMPDVLEGILAQAGHRMSDLITLREPRPAFRYLYPDGAVIDVYPSADETVEALRRSMGSEEADELSRFLAYAGRIWDAAAPHFVYGEAPSFTGVMSLGMRTLMKLTRIDPLRSMKTAIDRQVRSPHLRRLLYRYATYNGSDVRSAPATLNCIAHVELALGGFGVEGGISAIVRALVQVAEAQGVVFRYDAPVERILDDGGRATGVVVAGREHSADMVVANADPAQVFDQLAPSMGLTAPPGSMSGWNGILRAARGGVERVAHTVAFCDDYDQEFADIFDHDRPPQDPTVYLCAQEACHGRAGWADSEAVFVMANAPAEPPGGPRAPAVWDALEQAVLQRARDGGLCGPGDRLIWRRTPTDLAAQFPGSRGSIYGASSNDMLAAFKRPANQVSKLPGLYMASGGAHPGGGMPLAMLSGVAAARAAAKDQGL